ncbi:YibE/F family protein [Heliobacterium gestii]|uniref:YibE/F family protein n=2 Tax=Heliomicrobium gestii TaxID=2699 RepID=A0A845L896_HELGE|nr:YibE/F family protein [Heliomicrobium gestii]MBM7865560.1 putative membrane protein [Heliomicrobium gestii]MZP41811.1 YibE/F family protein [Heliomicrobium gestii]
MLGQPAFVAQAAPSASTPSSSPSPNSPNDAAFEPPQEMYLKGKVASILAEYPEADPLNADAPSSLLRQTLLVELLDPPFQGQTQVITNSVNLQNPYNGIYLHPGEEVVVYGTLDAQGRLQGAAIQDLIRHRPILTVAAIFVVLIVVLGGRRGIAALVTLALTGVLIWYVLLPAILKGQSPLLASSLVCAVIGLIGTPIIGGLNRKSLAAVAGIIAGVIAAGLLAYLTGQQARITGIEFEYATMMLAIPNRPPLDLQGVYFAGVLIGSLGAVMDTSLTVASAAQEIRQLHKTVGRKELWQAGMNVGRDTMGMMSSTLILAYVGGALSLLVLLMAYETPALKIINSDLLVSEIIRSAAGSIGLILCIPVTAFCSAFLLSSSGTATDSADEDKRTAD